MVFDKATIDSMLCGVNGRARAREAVAEAARVLRAGGHLVLVSLAAPEARLWLLDEATWSTETLHVRKPDVGDEPSAADGGPQSYFVYVARRRERQ
jgi:ubiquinone/menaquinone biosynthesis C-methylase UbiE